jgi:hypothetical protein
MGADVTDPPVAGKRPRRKRPREAPTPVAWSAEHLLALANFYPDMTADELAAYLGEDRPASRAGTLKAIAGRVALGSERELSLRAIDALLKDDAEREATAGELSAIMEKLKAGALTPEEAARQAAKALGRRAKKPRAPPKLRPWQRYALRLAVEILQHHPSLSNRRLAAEILRHWKRTDLKRPRAGPLAKFLAKHEEIREVAARK